jgi:hypothetical protein
MLRESLTRLAQRVADPRYDSRHAILDVSSELLSIDTMQRALPESLRLELSELLRDVKAVQPSFPSRRATSPLFDREGMGQIGRDRALRLVQRLKAVAAAVESLEQHSQ